MRYMIEKVVYNLVRSLPMRNAVPHVCVFAMLHHVCMVQSKRPRFVQTDSELGAKSGWVRREQGRETGMENAGVAMNHCEPHFVYWSGGGVRKGGAEG